MFESKWPVSKIITVEMYIYTEKGFNSKVKYNTAEIIKIQFNKVAKKIMEIR